MTITLYRYISERNRVDKSDYLIYVGSATGSFKADTSVLNPTLLLSLPAEGMQLLTDESGNEIDDVMVSDGGENEILNFNYLYIAEFRRYYYVTSIVVSSDRLLVVSCSVDPLYSFKDAILQNHGMVERNEFDYDLRLEDNIVPFRTIKDIDEYELNGDVAFDTLAENHNIVITTIDTHDLHYNALISNPLHIYYPDYLENERNIDDGGFVDPKRFTALQESKILVFPDWEQAYKTFYSISKAYDSKINFIKSMMAYPFEVPHDDVPGDEDIYAQEKEDRFRLYLGNEPINDLGSLHPNDIPKAVYLPASKYRFSNPLVIARFTLNGIADDFTGKTPYTRVELYVPYYGWIEINTQEIFPNAFYELFYIVDYESGNADFFLVRKAIAGNIKSTILYTNTCQLGVKIPLDITNFNEIQARRNAIAQQTALSLVSSAISIGVGVASSNPMAVVGGVISGGMAIGNAISQNGMLFEKAQANYGSGAMGLFGYQKARIKITRLLPVIPLDSTSFAHQFGRPLRQVRTLSTLKGFTQISKIHLEELDALDPEKEAIESSLLSGVLL